MSLSHSHELAIARLGGLLSSKQVPSRRSKNVVQVAASRAKLRIEGEQKGEKRLARFCQNLRLFSGLRRLRQDLVNLVSRLQSRCSDKLNDILLGRNYHPPNIFRRLRRLFQQRFSLHSVQLCRFQSAFRLFEPSIPLAYSDSSEVRFEEGAPRSAFHAPVSARSC